ncbi:MAG: F0F1 ATP synthase subunit B' [Rhodospirillaceae bacterium]|jgi:F-type H+-transporting ATPase subunit b|nr:F0F1 ATP synthase subunit B' [Rhodospirillaceae bacterium]MBT5241223.1 F0F1 ATP synthase subunit B' [Rhodospirillaceae bacterium]MBT5565142.1 F0F1 ATP synthase subunit B' [Rhodospirillaceae bacterium]MBT6088164.1 F0F1 ATP synthase subunit B' [Rhodospirillaceae bacterium]MBT6962247.1 F0F1 ATP synthase subunit B' [Rhodospirillaceae bacterium]
MPQFDPSTFSSQLFWLLICFVVLYWVISKFAIPRIGDILEQRERVVQDDLDRAESLKGEAEQALADYEAAMANAREQARTLMFKVTSDAKVAAEARNRDIGAELTVQIADAEQRIATARDDAMASLTSIAADAAKDAASRLAGLEVNSGDAEAAVSAAMKGNG